MKPPHTEQVLHADPVVANPAPLGNRRRRFPGAARAHGAAYCRPPSRAAAFRFLAVSGWWLHCSRRQRRLVRRQLAHGPDCVPVRVRRGAWLLWRAGVGPQPRASLPKDAIAANWRNSPRRCILLRQGHRGDAPRVEGPHRDCSAAGGIAGGIAVCVGWRVRAIAKHDPGQLRVLLLRAQDDGQHRHDGALSSSLAPSSLLASQRRVLL